MMMMMIQHYLMPIILEGLYKGAVCLCSEGMDDKYLAETAHYFVSYVVGERVSRSFKF